MLTCYATLLYTTFRYVFRRAKDWSLDNLIAETLGPGLPLVGSLFRNISFCFLYSVAALEYPCPLTSNMVRVGGMHIQRNRTMTLPEVGCILGWHIGEGEKYDLPNSNRNENQP